jgi:hypothetical protein
MATKTNPRSKENEPSAPARGNPEQTPGKRASWQHLLLDFAGVILLAFALMSLLALVFPEMTRGILLTWWADFLWTWFGWGCIWAVAAITGLGMLMFRY